MKALVTGEVKCINEKDCENLKVLLTPTFQDNLNNSKEIISNIQSTKCIVFNYIAFIFSLALDNKYKFEDIRPGIYKIKLSQNNFCWKENHFTISVNSDRHQVQPFKQTGYAVIFSSTHDAKVYKKYSYMIANLHLLL